jgi:hypothetical protein
MLLPRTADRCIVCLREPPFANGFGFSEEHIIPAALGGVLTCEFLCKKCNDAFGATFEAKAKTDPAIRNAIRHLRDQLPELHASMENGQAYRIRTDVGDLPGVFRGREIKGRTKRLEDGSLMASSDETEPHLRGIMQKKGHTPEQIAAALEKLKLGPEETQIELAPDFYVIKRMAFDGGPDFAEGESLKPLVSLKIAYEFAVLSFGPPVLVDNPALNEIRRTLHECDAESLPCRVDSLVARDRKYQPIHGIAFEGNHPHATIQVRLFGYLAYRVHFPSLCFDHKPFAYTHYLDTGEECLG